MSFRFVEMSDDLVGPVCQAFTRVFGELRTEDAWRRIYADAPDGSFGIVALNEADQVVGHYGATLHRFAGADGGEFRFGLTRDVFTQPAARGAGTGRGSVFAGMGTEFHKGVRSRGVAVTFGFASDRHFRLGARILGYKRISGWAVWGRAVPAAGIRSAARLGRLAPVAMYGNEMDSLWSNRAASGVVGTPRTAAFLNWRFVHRIDRRYLRFRYDSLLLPGIAGYAVVALHGEEARLADFHFPADPDLRHDMWRQLLDRVARLGAKTLVLLASSAVPETACMQSLGCAPMDPDLFSIPAYRGYDQPWLDFEFGGRFHLTMADADIF
jgi:hypothetical protein